MKNNSENIEIIITVIKKNKNLLRVLNSLSNQSYLPKKIIIVSFENLKKLKYKKLNIKIVKSKKKNQVFQRTLGLKHLSKTCDILLQLDERVILKKNALKNLNACWKTSKSNIVGIGLNPINVIDKYKGFFNIVFEKLGFSGKILNNGINIRYSNLQENKEVDWLKGGLSSWRIKKIPHIHKRRFPMWEWSVGEDVEFSLSIRKKQKLIVCSNSKASFLKQNTILNNQTFKKRGYLHSLSAKRISRKIYSNKFFFSLNSLIIILLSLFFYSITLNMPKIFYSIGRLKGHVIG